MFGHMPDRAELDESHDFRLPSSSVISRYVLIRAHESSLFHLVTTNLRLFMMILWNAIVN